MKKNKSRFLITGLFLGIMFVGGVVSARNAIPVLKTNFENNDEYFKNGGKNFEEDYRNSFTKKREWINVYGFSQKLLGRKILGNVEFALADTGVIENVRNVSVIPFVNEIQELKKELDQRQIDLLYVQMPPRDAENSSNPEQLFSARRMNEIIDKEIEKANIVQLDEKELFNDETNFTAKDLYFKTDIHPTTRGEAWMADQIAKKLQKEFGIKIDGYIGQQGVEYKKISHDFIGNFAQSIGEYYIGIDQFEEYMPINETSYLIHDASGTWENRGSFENVIMNGYKANEKDEKYTYWVTNYLRYGLPKYHIENLMVEGPEIMVICDSMCYRTLSYLSLGCKTITVIDPRFYTQQNIDENILKRTLDEKPYDAVIYLHGKSGVTAETMF